MRVSPSAAAWFLLCVPGCVPSATYHPARDAHAPELQGDLVDITCGTFSATVGEKSFVPVMIRNRGNAPLWIPLRGEPACTGSVIVLKVRKKDGGEEVSYPTTTHVAKADQPDQLPILILRNDRQFNWLSTWFIPWSPGDYEYNLTVDNSIREMLERVCTQDEHGLTSFVKKLQPIPNVWVGKATFSGAFRVEDALTNRPEELGGTRLRVRLESLTADVLNKGLPLNARLGFLAALVKMRHVYACDALLTVEKETRGDAVMHPGAVRALHQMAYCGTGYRALSRFAELAQGKDLLADERALCLDALETFARRREIIHEGRTIHIVTEEEKKLAQIALDQLKVVERP